MRTSSTIRVGYGHFQAPSGFSIWTPTFKNVDQTDFSLLDVTPCKVDTTVIDGDAKVKIFKLNTDNTWGATYSWYGSKGGWSKDNGATIVTDKAEVKFTVGEGFAMNNSLTEGSGRTAKAVPVAFRVAGEVDLTCQNTCPSGFAICGNSSPVARDLTDFIPRKTDGSVVDGDAKVKVFKINTDNTWGATYSWYGSKSGWSKDNGATILTDKTEVVFAAGEGFAMNNSLTEGSGRTAKAVPVVMSYTSPVAK